MMMRRKTRLSCMWYVVLRVGVVVVVMVVVVVVDPPPPPLSQKHLVRNQQGKEVISEEFFEKVPSKK